MTDTILSVAIVSVFLAGAIATYRHMFNRQIRERIQRAAIRAMRTGTTSREASRNVDFSDIRFHAFCYAIAWPYYWAHRTLKMALTKRDDERREALSRVAQMIIEERKNVGRKDNR